jgi:hypothetical protein
MLQNFQTLNVSRIYQSGVKFIVQKRQAGIPSAPYSVSDCAGS